LPSDAVQFHPETDLLAYTLDRAAADRLAFAQTLRVPHPILVLLQVRSQSPQRLTFAFEFEFSQCPVDAAAQD